MRKLMTRLMMLVLLVVLVAVPAKAADWEGARNALIAGMKNEAASIDISAYGIHRNDISKLTAEAADKGYFPWYVDRFKSFSYTYYISSGIVVEFKPVYLDRVKYNRNAYEAKVKEALDKCVDKEMSQWQIALSLHASRFEGRRFGTSHLGQLPLLGLLGAVRWLLNRRHVL